MILIRKSIALDNAVNLITLPVIFFHFESFPLFSFFFNLIIPLLLLPSLYLLMLGLMCAPLTALETTLHAWNHAYTKSILDYVAACPKILETTLTLKNMSATACAVGVLMIFLSLLILEKKHAPLRRFA
jgi:predicted membrane metal-binding protein